MDEQTTDETRQVPSHTPDFQTELAKKIQALVPEVVTDGKVDVKKLKDLLDKDAADETERFGLFWPGKTRAMRAAQEPTTATLKPVKSESKDWDTTENLFIEGDNLETLKILQRYYHNKIKMIYIDPPYNTGRDFVYPDNYKEGLASYLEFTKQVDDEGRKMSTNSDTDGRYHSNWLNMMYPRLKLARNLLTDDGVIFVSIDDNEQTHLKKLCDEIFGEDNVEQMIWQKNDFTDGVLKLTRRFRVEHEYVICCYRNKAMSEFNKVMQLSQIKNVYGNPDDDERGAWISAELGASEANSRKDHARYFKITAPNGKEWHREWLFDEAEVTRLIEDGRVYFGKDGNAGPRLKKFVNEKRPKAATSILREYGSARSGAREIESLFNERVFDYPKPIELVQYLASLVKGKDYHVMDFFSGSGGAAQAIMSLNADDGGNRKHIQVQLPEPTDTESIAHKAGYETIAEISKERIRLAGEKIKVDQAAKLADRDTPLDTGFKVFKLSDSNFTKWRSSSNVDKEALQQHLLDIRESSNDAATEEDLLIEVLLKQGISLTAKITHEDISNLSVWNVGETTVLAYLDEHKKPDLAQLREITDKEPAKFIILEDAFHGDDELKTNLAQICKTSRIELWTV